MKVRVYLWRQMLLKIGGRGINSLIILDGEALVFGINQEFIGFLKPGAHFSNHRQLSYNDKHIANVVANSLMVVGYLGEDEVQLLQDTYPEWFEKFRKLNDLFHENFLEPTLKRHLRAAGKPDRLEHRVKAIEQYSSTASEETYRTLFQRADALRLDEKAIKEKDIKIALNHQYFGKVGQMPTRGVPSPAANRYTVRRVSTQAEVLVSHISDVQESETSCCSCTDFYFSANSKGRTIIDFVQLFNLLYIAIATPL